MSLHSASDDTQMHRQTAISDNIMLEMNSWTRKQLEFSISTQ